MISPLKRVALVLCPLILFAALKQTVEVARFHSFVSGIHETTIPYQKRIALAGGARLLAQGETRCGGMTGDCATLARIQIRWRDGALETVGQQISFGESSIEPVQLSRVRNRWQLRLNDQTWTRNAKNVWSSG